MTDQEANRRLERGLKQAIKDAELCLQCIRGGIDGELSAIEGGRTGDLLRRVEEIHQEACAALRFAQTAETFRRLLWEIK